MHRLVFSVNVSLTKKRISIRCKFLFPQNKIYNICKLGLHVLFIYHLFSYSLCKYFTSFHRLYENIANSQNKTLNIVSFRNWRDSRSFLRRGGTPIGLILVFKEDISHLRLREGSGRGGCQRALWDCFSGRICRHVENASPKKVPQCALTTSSTRSPAQPRSGECHENILVLCQLSAALPNTFTHTQILLSSYEENIIPKNVSGSTGQNNFWSFLQAWH